MLGDYFEVDEWIKGEDNRIIPFDIALTEQLSDTFSRVSAKAYIIEGIPAASFNYLLVM